MRIAIVRKLGLITCEITLSNLDTIELTLKSMIDLVLFKLIITNYDHISKLKYFVYFV
jgi:hypothetical protein